MKSAMQKLIAMMLAMMLAVTCSGITALADNVLTLPSSLTIIDTEAFYGDTSISKVVLPEHITEIRARAFAGSTLTEINLPDSLERIADDALPGPGQVTVTANPGSKAYDWAVDKGYIEPVLMIRSLTMEKESLTKGETGNWTAAAMGGTAPYKYRFTLYKGSSRIDQTAYRTQAAYEYTFTEAGSYHLTVQVRDDDFTYSDVYTGSVFEVGEGENGLTVTLTPDRESAYLHETISWTAEAAGGTAPYRYSFRLMIDGKQEATQAYSTDNVFTCTAEKDGDYTLQVNVLDAENNGTTLTSGPYSVLLAELTVEGFYADMPEAMTEDTVTWYALASGGQEPYTYAFTLTKDGTTVDTRAAGEEGSYSFQVMETGNYSATVTARDVLGHEATAAADCMVSLRPVAITGIAAESESYMTGDPVTWTVTAEGGDRNYTYAFALTKDGEEIDGRGFTADNTFSCIPTEPGTYAIEARVKDGERRSASLTGGEITISVHPLEIRSMTADSGMVRLGGSVTMTTRAVGGQTPLRYSYEIYNGEGTLVAATPYSAANGYSFTAQEAGTYTFKVKVKDAEGTEAEETSEAVTFYDVLAVSGITASQSSVLTGEGVTWTAERTGGKGTITYVWFICRDGVQEYTEQNTDGSVTWAPKLSGNYTARVIARDEDGDEQEYTGGAVTSSAHDATPQEDFTFRPLNGNNGSFCELVKYNGTDSAVIIPGEWTDENGVTRILQKINDSAFKENETITSVIIPDSVETMGLYVFWSCKNLIYVRGGTGLTAIGGYAFNECENLRGYDFQPATETIGNYAFRGCDAITHFEGWPGLKTIGSDAFYGNTTLRSINLVSSVTQINTSAFSYCTGLTSVTLPDGLKSIGSYAFGYCSGLTAVHLPDSITYLESAFCSCENLVSVNYPKGWATGSHPFEGCEKLTVMHIPEGVTAIPAYAFCNSGNFTEITLPGTLKTIGMYAFASATGLTVMEIPAGVATIPKNAFDSCSGLTEIRLPQGLTAINSEAFENCTGLTEVTLPDSITFLGSEAFGSCSNLTSINYPKGWTSGGSPFTDCVKLVRMDIPEGVTAIPQCAFQNASNFNVITLPETLESIGEYAFSYCAGLRSMTIPAGVTTIPRYCFQACAGLTSVSLPETLTRIESEAFRQCDNLAGIYLPDSITYLGTEVFDDCDKLATVNYPKGWTSGGSPFSDCPKLVKMEVPEGVTAIPAYAFRYAASLNQITLPDTLERIGNEAFGYCTGLRSITIPSGVTVIPEEAFEGCAGLTSVSLPDGLERIERRAFQLCSGLVSIHLPDSITYLGTEVFDDCDHLESVNYPRNWTSGGSPFRDCERLKTVTIPEGVTAIPAYAFMSMYTLEQITLPGTLRSIGNGSFSYCTNLQSVIIGDLVESFGEECFYDCPEDLVFYGVAHSDFIQEYVEGLGYTFTTEKPETVSAGSVDATVSVYSPAGETREGTLVSVREADTRITVGEAYTDGTGSAVICSLEPGRLYQFAGADEYFEYPSVYTVVNEAQNTVALNARRPKGSYAITAPESATAGQTGENLSFAVEASGPWTASTEEEWIGISTPSGEPDGQLRLTIQANLDTFRYGFVTVSTGDASYRLTIRQPGPNSYRLPDPTILYPAADGDEVAYGDILVSWAPSAGAESYVVSLRDLETDTLLINHETQGDATSARLSTEYFCDNRQYRVAVGAVVPGTSSKDVSTGWSERVFRVSEYTSTEAIEFTGEVSLLTVTETTQLRSRDPQENGVGLKFYEEAMANAWVYCYHLIEADNTWHYLGKVSTDNGGGFTLKSSEFIEGDRYKFTVEAEGYTNLYDMEDMVYEAHRGKNQTVHFYVYSDTYADQVEALRNLRTFEEEIKGRNHGLFAEYFAYTDKNAAFTSQNKRNENIAPTIDFSWAKDEYTGYVNNTGNGSDLSKVNYYLLNAYRFNDKQHTGTRIQQTAFVPFKFAARFNGYIKVKGSENPGIMAYYQFRVRGDDGVTLRIEKPNLDAAQTGRKWDDGSENTVTLNDAGYYLNGNILKVTIEYYNRGSWLQDDANLILEYRMNYGEEWKTVPNDWLYAGNRTVSVLNSGEGTAGINYVKQLTEADQRILNYGNNLLKDAMNDAMGGILDMGYGVFEAGTTFTPSTVQKTWNKAAGIYLGKKTGKKVAKAVYGAVFDKVCSMNNEETIWQAIRTKVQDEFSVDFEIEDYMEGAEWGIDTYETLMNFYDAMSENNITAFVSGSKRDAIIAYARDDSRTNPLENIFDHTDPEEQEDEVEEFSNLDVNLDLIWTTAKKSIKLLKRLYSKDDANTNRATLYLLYKEQNQSGADLFSKKLLDAALNINGGENRVWSKFVDGNHLPRHWENDADYLNTLSWISNVDMNRLMACYQGVRLEDILYKELLVIVLDAAVSQYKGLAN